MKKIIFIGLLFVAIVFISGCSYKKNELQKEENQPTKKLETIEKEKEENTSINDNTTNNSVNNNSNNQSNTDIQQNENNIKENNPNKNSSKEEPKVSQEQTPNKEEIDKDKNSNQKTPDENSNQETPKVNQDKNNNTPKNDIPSSNQNSELDNLKDNKSNIQTEKIAPTKKYYCPDGFTLNGNKCEKAMIFNAIEEKSCPQGYVLSYINNDCEKEEKKYIAYTLVCPGTNASQNWEYINEYCASRGLPKNRKSCLKGNYDSITDKCVYTETVTTDITYKYSCINDMKLNGNKCEDIFSAEAYTEYICPTNYTLVGSMCEKK